LKEVQLVEGPTELPSNEEYLDLEAEVQAEAGVVLVLRPQPLLLVAESGEILGLAVQVQLPKVVLVLLIDEEDIHLRNEWLEDKHRLPQKVVRHLRFHPPDNKHQLL
jgi:hypothetical protein